MSMKMTVFGLRQLQINFWLASTKLQDALSAAIYQESLEVAAEAKKRTPVDTGRLRATGYAAPPVETMRGPEGEVGFGTNYAVYVHEALSAFHRVGGPKFLESVVNERQKGYRQRMADRVTANFAAGIGVSAIPASEPRRPKR